MTAGRAPWGWLTAHEFGETLRAATADEWRKGAALLSAQWTEEYGPLPPAAGAWAGDDGTQVYVDGGPDPWVDDADIERLELESARAGDGEAGYACMKALGVLDGTGDHGEEEAFLRECVRDPEAREALRALTKGQAREECIRIILDDRMAAYRGRIGEIA